MADKRKLINLLPELLQSNNQLSKFFSSTVDPLFQPEEKKKLAGYIGRIPSYFDPDTDFYVVEPTSERQFYQLEPSMISRDADDINLIETYPDLVDHLRFQGANVEDHSRLFKQNYYSWAPPIAIDKFTNFSNYYWYPEGTTPIAITSTVSQAIDVDTDILGQTNYTSPNGINFFNGIRVVFGNDSSITPASYRNRTYIVEGVGRAILLVDADLMDPLITPLEYTVGDNEYITISRGSQDENPWSRSNHWYHKDVITLLDTTDDTLVESDAAVLWDADPWDINPWDAIITSLTPLFNLDSNRQARRPIIEFERNIELYQYSTIQSRRADLLEDVKTDIFTDIHGQLLGTVTVDGVPLNNNDTIFVISDTNTIINNRIYDVSLIETSPAVFVYNLTLDNTGLSSTGSPVQGEKVLILAGTNIGKEFYFDGISYSAAQSKVQSNQAPLFNLYSNDADYIGDPSLYPESSFIGNEVFSYQVGESNLTADIELGFPVVYRNFNQIAEIVFENDIINSVSFESASLQREDIPGYFYFKINTDEYVTEAYGNNWNWSEIESEQAFDAFYDIPMNLQGNPDYDEVTTITRSEALNHFVSIIENQEGITGTNFTSTNYRNTARDVSKGNVIVQNEASMIKLMLMASSDHYDYMLATRYVSNEYKRFRNKIIYKAESFINQGLTVDTPIYTWVDDIINSINVTKKDQTLFPFGNTRVMPTGDKYIFATDVGPGSTFDIPDGTIFDPTVTGTYDAVSVYVNNVLLFITDDYTVNGDEIVLTNALTSSDSIEIRYYDDVRGSFLPATGAVLGLTPVFKPERILDTAYPTDTPIIICHDGSVHITFGNIIDDIIFEIETRIYNTIYEKFKGDRFHAFDAEEILPGNFRDSDYTLAEYRNIITPIFTTWATQAGINWSENSEDTTFDQGDWKTWNWTGVNTPSGTELVGSWRAVYKFAYDTDRPHTHPWEMLGFSEKPTWWESSYGTDYGSTNNVMWKDLEDGRILQGTRAGINPLYVRTGLSVIIPLDANGDLQSPSEIGIAVIDPTIVEAAADWAPGDMSPSEVAFWRSTERTYFQSQLYYLMRPAKWTNLGWETETLIFSTADPKQFINTDFGYRPHNAELQVDLEPDNLGVAVTKSGIQQWIANKLQFDGTDISTTLGDDLRGTGVSLAWKAAGFIYDQNLRFQADAFSPGSSATTQTIFIRDDDMSVELQQSNSVREVFYGGAIIEWTGIGYRVVGYDAIFPYFRTIPSDKGGRSVTVSIGTSTVTEFKTGQFDIFEDVPYGFEFGTKQEVYDFLISYGRYLESEGWAFDEFDQTSNEILNWRNSAKEFLFWSDDSLVIDAFIALSPFANKVSFVTATGQVQNVEEIIRGTYSILDRSGAVIKPNDTLTYREEELFEVSPVNEQGIFALRLSIKEYENIVVFENTTRFNDVVYDPLFNLRQTRLKAFGQMSDNWTGRFDAPGFIIDNTSDRNLLPSYEKLAEDFRHYYDIENPSENDDITDIARHQIGYQRRQYMDNLLIDRDTQYQFYQGMLHQKGSRNSLNRLFRSTAITSSSDVSFLEEWALRVNQYGALDSQKFFEIKLASTEIKNNPQIIRFVGGSRIDSPNDTIIDVVPNDARWISANNREDVNKFATRAKNIKYKKDMPNAGYPVLGESEYMMTQPDLILSSTTPAFNAQVGETVWIARDPDGHINRNSWDVLLAIATNQYAFSSDDDTLVVNTYELTSSVSDGIVKEFSVPTAEFDFLVNSDIIVYVDGAKTDEWFVLSSNEIEFNDSPNDGAIVDIYTAATSVVTDIITFNGATRENGIVASIDSTSITLESIVDLEPSGNIETAPIISWKSLRFASASTLADEALLYPNNILYFDQDVNNTGWEVYQTLFGTIKFERGEEDLVDIFKIDNSIIYNSFENRRVSTMTTYDPFKGNIIGLADSEITYKLEYDPARFNIIENEETDVERVWGRSQVGKVWWDTSAVTYLYYEQGSLEYRYQNWGSLFAGTSIRLYEWVKSPVAPEDWADYVSKSNDNFNFVNSGTVKDIDSDQGPSWVETTEFGLSVYYFWIENSSHVPNVEFRSTSLFDLEKIIEDPSKEDLKYVSILDTNVFMIGNVETDLNDLDTVLQFNYTQIDTDSPIHTQWELLRENDSFSIVNDLHWNKMRDSLVGYDDLGLDVPDNELTGNARFGHLIRPRQTWFKDKALAREVFIVDINETLASMNLVDSLVEFEDRLNENATIDVVPTVILGTVPNPTVSPADQMSINGEIIILSGLSGTAGIADDINNQIANTNISASVVYSGTDAFISITDISGASITLINTSGTPVTDIGLTEGLTVGAGPTYTVATRADRDALLGLTIGDRVYVVADERLRSFWSYWTYLGTNSSTGDEWELIEIQSYNTSAYWSFIDWYDVGYSTSTIIDVTVQTIFDRNSGGFAEGTLVEVLNDGSNNWAWYVATSDSWIQVAKQNATIEFSETLYNSVVGEYGFDVQLYDVAQFDDIPNVEFRNIIDSIKIDIFATDQLVINNLFFNMLNHVHAENKMIDWAFKTSYVYVVGFTDELSQRPIFTNDGFDSLIDYVNEIKPYHSKLKDIIRTFATATDIANVSVIDWDKPVYNDDGTLRILDETDADDQAILATDPWLNWFGEYQKDDRPNVPRVNNVRKITAKMTFNRISSIRTDYVPTRVFPTHPDYPDTLAPTPFYDAIIDGTTAKDIRNITFLEDYKGTPEQLLDASGDGSEFFWEFDGDLTDSGASNVDGSIATGTELYTDSLLPNLPLLEAFAFDGNTVVTMPDTADINTGSQTSKAISLVFNLSNVHTTSPQILYKQGAADAGLQISVYNDGSTTLLYFYIWTNSGAETEILSTSIQLNRTYFATVGFNMLADTMSIKLDGKIVASNVGLSMSSLDGSTGDIEFGGMSNGLIQNIPGLPNTVIATSMIQGAIQYVAYYNSGVSLSDHVDVFNAIITDIDQIYHIRKTPFDKQIPIIATGITDSSIIIESNTEADFSGTTETLTTFTQDGTVFVRYNNIEDTPYLRVNVNSFVFGDSVSVTSDIIYENALSRVLDFYQPQSGMPNLLEVATTYYLGTIIDGLTLNLDTGWDVSPWDFAAWDIESDIEDVFDLLLDGGSHHVYQGDDATATFNLPAIGVSPWFVAATEISNGNVTVLILGADYTIDTGANTITVLAGNAWMNGNFLDAGWYLTILDSSYLALSDDDVIINGFNFLQPDVLGWPEELVPAIATDSTLLTVVTSGGLTVTPLNAVTELTDSEVFTFAGITPIIITVSGISGDTVVIEGSNTGAFSGEETSIVSITTNSTVTFPDLGNGYSAFTYYRARVTVFAAGTITVEASVDYSPKMKINDIVYDAGIGTGPYDVNNTIVELDDMLISLNGKILEHTVDYTVNTTNNTFTFTAGQTPGDLISVYSWDITGTVASNPIWTDITSGFVGADYDLAANNVETSPTFPQEGSAFVFADTGSGFFRLAPPVARYYTANGADTDFKIDGIIYTTGNVAVWLDNVLLTDTVEYTLTTITGESVVSMTTPPAIDSKITIRALGNEDYSIDGGVLTIVDNANPAADTIALYVFLDSDASINLQTHTWPGHAVLSNGVYTYPIDALPTSKEKIIVTIYDDSGTDGSITRDFTYIPNGLWDFNTWDASPWDFEGGTVNLTVALTSSDKVVISSFNGTERLDTVTYRELSGFGSNINDTYREFTRFSDATKTILSVTMQPSDASIALTDAGIFDNDGVIWVNGERIEYLQKTGGANPGDPGTLTGLVRGSKGTRKNKIHRVGDTARNGSASEIIPNAESIRFNDPSLKLQESSNQRAKFLNVSIGGYKNFI